MDGLLLATIIIGAFVGASFVCLLASIWIWPPAQQVSRAVIIRRRLRPDATVNSNDNGIVESSAPPTIAVPDEVASEMDIEHGSSRQFICMANQPRNAVAIVINPDPIIHVISETITKQEQDASKVAVVIGQLVECVY